MALDEPRKVMNIDHRLLDAGFSQAVEHVIEKRLSGDLDKRLRRGRRQRAHALAESGGKDHGTAGFGLTGYGLGGGGNEHEEL